MNTKRRSLGSTVVLLLVVVAIGVIAFALWPTHTPPIAADAAQPAPALIEQGRYLADAGDCSACHTAPGGQSFAGGLPLASPIGTIYSSNITPDPASGIGGYTLDEFDRALRHGIRRDGATLYPAMPYPSYRNLSDADVQALYAYFTHAVTPVATPNRATDIRWPLSLRWPLAIWRKLFVPADERIAFDPARYADARVARGAYLVQGLGHCGSCHTARAVTLQEVALDERSADYLAGGQLIDGWVAVNLRGDSGDGLGRWSAQEIADVLRSARTHRYAVIGSPMNDVVMHSTQYLRDDDLAAIAAYLKTLPGNTDNKIAFEPSDETALALRAGRESGRGAELYLDNCAACHRSHGNGEEHAFPAIAGNSTVLAENPASLIRLILIGSRLPSTRTAPSPLGMPGFAWRLSDQEVAQLLTFVRSSWGNAAPGVGDAEVARVRAEVGRPLSRTE